MDIKKLEKVIELLKKNQLSEIDMTSGKDHIRVVETPAAQPAQGNYVHSIPAPPSGPSSDSVSAPQAAESSDSIKGHVVKSPFIGNYYEASSPGAEAFVKVGDKVKKGQSLCIVEAMKLMNEIEADKAGTITKIFLKNEDPVEFEQNLFVID